MVTVLHETRSGRSGIPAPAARLMAGVALGCVLCGPVLAQETAGSGDETGDNLIWTDPVAPDSDALADGGSDDGAGETDAISTGSTKRTEPVGATEAVQGGGGATEDDPYAAPGIPVGSFVLRPTLDIGLSGQREAGETSLLGDTALRLQLDSDWERHSLSFTADGRLQRSFEAEGELDPEFSASAEGTLDLGAGATVTGTFGYSYQTDDPQSAAYVAATDPGLIPAVTGVNEPAIQTLDGSLSLRKEFGRFFTEAGVSAAHEIYGDAKLSDGSIISQGDLDNTTIDGRLRAGIGATSVFSPFIEGTYGVRRMVETPDSGGVDRNAVRYGLHVGTGIDLGEKMSGEVSAGYVVEDIADPALEDVSGVALAASLDWSPQRGTDVSLGLGTSTETSGKDGNGGALLYSAELGVTHRLRANWTAEAGFDAEYRQEDAGADEATLSGELALTYWFNRFTGLTTRAGHEQVLSPDPTQRSNTTTAYVGLRLQR